MANYPEQFERQYQSHLRHLKLKGLQPKTIDAYARGMRRVGKYFSYQVDASHSWGGVKLDLYSLKFLPNFRRGLCSPPRVCSATECSSSGYTAWACAWARGWRSRWATSRPARVLRLPAWICPTRRTGSSRYLPSSNSARMSGHACLRYSPVSITVRLSTPALPLLAFTRFHARTMFSLASACLSRSPPLGPSVRVAPSMPAHARVRALASPPPSVWHPLFAASEFRPLQATRLVTLLLVQPFARCRATRLLLTSRSGSSPSPFPPQGEISPGKNAILHRTTPAFTSPDPWPQELRRSLPARPWSASPRMRFVYLGSRFTLHASSPRSVALTQLRFTCLTVASSAGDFHPENPANWAHNGSDRGFARSILNL